MAYCGSTTLAARVSMELLKCSTNLPRVASIYRMGRERSFLAEKENPGAVTAQRLLGRR